MLVSRPRLGLFTVAFALLATPVLAQMQPGPDVTCLCLKQSVDDLSADLNAKQAELGAAQTTLGNLDAQLAAARAQADVNSPQSVAQFRELLAQRDTAFRQSNGGALAAVQATTARYNQAVADYNGSCAGRPLPPPPPGPLVCPAAH
jgi:hypothetical protein